MSEIKSQKSKIITVVVALVLIIGLIVLIAISQRNDEIIGGFQVSSFEFDVTYKDGSDTIVTAFDFAYNNVKDETKSVIVSLNKESEILISNFEANSDCRIIVYDNDVQIWSRVIKDREIYTNIVEKEGHYDVSFIMSTGKGEGSVSFS